MPPAFDSLHAPFPPDQVHFRVGATAKRDGGKVGLPLCYLDARDVMDRLDTALGPENWASEFEHLGDGTVVCRLSIHIDSHHGWVTKSDGAGPTEVEAEKGQLSDALKRAAVSWGVGRYLYRMDFPWVRLDERGNIPVESQEKLRSRYADMIEGIEPPVVEEDPAPAAAPVQPAAMPATPPQPAATPVQGAMDLVKEGPQDAPRGDRVPLTKEKAKPIYREAFKALERVHGKEASEDPKRKWHVADWAEAQLGCRIRELFEDEIDKVIALIRSYPDGPPVPDEAKSETPPQDPVPF